MRKRNNSINVRLNDTELEKLNEKVFKSGLSREAFIRNVLNGVEIHTAPPVDFFNLIREIRRVGNNINQLVHYANGNGFVESKKLSEHLTELDGIEKELWKSFRGG